jgi:hypothetical protein
MKKLSKLQKTILLIGLENNDRLTGKVDVSNAEVKLAYYGFPGIRKRWGISFSKAAIGPSRYNTASSNIARSFDNLVKRGLAEREYGYGIRLTSLGREVAKKLKHENS